jgi:hypothetical protein
MTTGTIVAIVGGIAGIVFGLVTLFRNKKQDDNQQGRESGTVLSDLGYIKAGVDEIKSEQKEQRKTNIEFITRLSAVEESTKQAHKRIDELKRE